MVFNWFRRQFNNPTPAETVTEDPTPSSVEDVGAVEKAAEEEAAPAATDTSDSKTDPDTLAWAKAAYQNIKQQQANTTAIDTDTEPPVSTLPETVVEPSPAESQTTANLDPETASYTAEPVTAEATTLRPVVTEQPIAPVEQPEIATEPANDLSPSAANQVTPDLTPTTEPDAVVESTLPAWATDRSTQERLAALKEQSIEAPVAEEIVLDDEFLWSAKVLADQGRSPEEVSLAEIDWLKKLRQGLNKTRLSLVNQVKGLIGQGPLNADAVVAIETLLLQADVGIEATDYIVGLLQDKLRTETLPPDEAIAYLKQILRDLLDKPFQKDYEIDFVPTKDVLNIWLLTGVNGVGKTTTIGKLAHMSKASGYRCLIAAADTFRAAAVDQVKVWGQRSDIEVIANPGQNTDPAAVVFDAIAAAKARQTELLLVDTAGRLQNKKNLMDELGKMRRIIDKQAGDAQIESLLVLDATLGQNGLRQAQVFAEAAKLSGVVLTKLDGTAKGGVALAVVQQLGLPIRFIGAGEGIEDLRPFSSYEFVEALLSS
jgi:fused signal recognition particle receptor